MAALGLRPRLTSFARVILYDKREQGLSDRLGRPPTLEDSMDDLHAVLDAAGSERATIVGASEGGPMAMLFAATYPELTERLVIVGSFARVTQGPDFPLGIPREDLDAFFATIATNWASDDVLAPVAPSAAEAQPGEIRVSRTVADLVAGSGLRFDDRGEHELKGVPGTWRLLAVAA